MARQAQAVQAAERVGGGGQNRLIGGNKQAAGTGHVAEGWKLMRSNRHAIVGYEGCLGGCGGGGIEGGGRVWEWPRVAEEEEGEWFVREVVRLEMVEEQAEVGISRFVCLQRLDSGCVYLGPSAPRRAG